MRIAGRRTAFAMAVLLALALLLGVMPLASAEQKVAFTLFATSDMHGASTPTSNIAKIGAVIDDARTQADVYGEVIAIDLGDLVQGTLDAAYFSGGRQMLELLETMDFDYAIPGNHEFNFGIESLLENLDSVNPGYQYLSANIFQGTADTDLAAVDARGWSMQTSGAYQDIKPYDVRTVSLDGAEIKVGFLALAADNVIWGAEPESHLVGLQHVSAQEALDHYVPILKNTEQADIIVVLSHNTVEADEALAQSAAAADVDIMLGSHVHATFTVAADNKLYTSAGYLRDFNTGDNDLVYMNGKNNANALIQLAVTWDEGAQEMGIAQTTSLLYSSSAAGGATVYPDAKASDVVAKLNEYAAEIDAYKQEPLAKAVGNFYTIGTANKSSAGYYTADDELGDAQAANPAVNSIRGRQDTIMGNLITDYTMEFLNSAQINGVKDYGVDGVMQELWTTAVFVDGQTITRGAAYEVLRYENTLVIMEVTPAGLKTLLEDNADHYGGSFWCGVAGMTVEYDMTKPSGSRVVRVRLDGETADLNLADTTRILHIACDTNDTAGNNGFTSEMDLLAAGKVEFTPHWNRESFMDWLQAKGEIVAQDYADTRQIMKLISADQVTFAAEDTVELPAVWQGKQNNVELVVRETDANGVTAENPMLTLDLNKNTMTAKETGTTYLTFDITVKQVAKVTNYNRAKFSLTIPITVEETQEVLPEQTPPIEEEPPKTGDTGVALAAIVALIAGGGTVLLTARRWAQR